MKWISVEDELPAQVGEYIVCQYTAGSVSTFFKIDKFSDVTTSYYRVEQKYKEETNDEVIYEKFYKWDKDDITHWMELPEPPKKKE